MLTNWKQDLPFHQAVQHFQDNIEEWKHNIFGNIYKRQRRAVARLTGLQATLALKPSVYIKKLEADLRTLN